MNIFKLILLILIPVVISWVFVTMIINHYYNSDITQMELLMSIPKSIFLEFNQ